MILIELWKQKEPVILEDLAAGARIAVDCLVVTDPYTVEYYVINELAARQWIGSDRDPGDWTKPGLRGDIPVHDPHFIVSNYELVSYRFPVFGGNDNDAGLMDFADCIIEVCDFLKRACGDNKWFSGSPKCSVLAFNQDGSRNTLVDPGTEHLHVLPMYEADLYSLIGDGSVQSGKVLLIDAKRNKYGRFKKHIPYSYMLSNHPLEYMEVYKKDPKLVVFYCDHANSASPTRAVGYHEWLRREHPESRQQVQILRNGFGGWVQWLRDHGDVKEIVEILRC